MTITLNGNPTKVAENITIKELLNQTEGIEDRKGVAVAVNDDVVPRAEWETRKIEEGARVEVIQAVQGG